MDINIIIAILGFILIILGIGFHKFGIKDKIKVVIGILIIVFAVYNGRVVIFKEKEFKEDVSNEIQITHLISMGLSESEIENLGRNPLLKQAYEKGQEYERVGSFKKAIESYNEIIKYSLSSDRDRVSAYNLIGLCYFNLYELEKAKQNFKKAEEKIENLKDKKYKSNGKMITFHNIGRVYKELALWKDAQEYLECSLKESVKLGDDLQKAITLLNISEIYFQLNKYKIAIEKMFQAILAFQEALNFYIPKNFPIDYALTQNNLGTAYGTLAEVQDKVENCNKAIQAYQEALNFYIPKNFPIDYAKTQNNLGNTYRTLAEVEDRVGNCNKAILAYQESLKFYTLEDFPMNYALTQNNLGNAYRTLAVVVDKLENCNKAIQACQEALKVRTPGDFPMQYAMTQNNLGNTYRTLAEVEDREGNCDKAILAYQEALKFYTKEEYPEAYRIIEKNIKNAYEF